jgi:hypothetical protein
MDGNIVVNIETSNALGEKVSIQGSAEVQFMSSLAKVPKKPEPGMGM